MFLIDAQLPPGPARWLEAKGFPSEHVDGPRPGAATDDEIEAAAREMRAVIWPKDADFADRARRSPGLQVVWLRLGNTTNRSLRDRLTPLLPALESGDSLIEVR